MCTFNAEDCKGGNKHDYFLHYDRCWQTTPHVEAAAFLGVERIGEAKNPGPGAHRSHRRGKRSYEAQAARNLRKHPSNSPDASALADNLAERSNSEVPDQSLIIWHINIQGLRSHAAELAGRIRLATEIPHILCVNETLLDHIVGTVEIEGHEIIARWDRSYERGGVCIYASCKIAQKVIHLSNSKDAERAWCMVHTDHGPFLLGAKYRPPNAEVASIESCEREHNALAEQVLGSLLVGDLNVHHIPWLGHSRETSVCGKHLRSTASRMGLKANCSWANTRQVPVGLGFDRCSRHCSESFTKNRRP